MCDAEAAIQHTKTTARVRNFCHSSRILSTRKDATLNKPQAMNWTCPHRPSQGQPAPAQTPSPLRGRVCPGPLRPGSPSTPRSAGPGPPPRPTDSVSAAFCDALRMPQGRAAAWARAQQQRWAALRPFQRRRGRKGVQGRADDREPRIRTTSLTPAAAMPQAGAASAGTPQAAGTGASRSSSSALCRRLLMGAKDRTGFLWEHRISDSFGGQLKGLNLPLPGITPVTVPELHQG